MSDLVRINEHVDFFYKKVFIYIHTFKEAVLARDAGAAGVIVLFDEEYKMARLDLVLQIKKDLPLYCIAQARQGNALEIFLLDGCNVDMIHACILDHENTIETPIIKKNYKANFLTTISSLPEALIALDNQHTGFISGSTLTTIKDLNCIYTETNSKIIEFNRFKNINSMNKFSKEHNINKKLVENISKNRRLPVPHFATGLIKNPIDAVNIMRIGYDALILDHSLFNTRNPLLAISLIVKAVESFANNLDILASCAALYKKTKKDCKG